MSRPVREPTLTIVGGESVPPERPAAGGTEVEVWRGTDGRIAAYGFCAAAKYWMEFPGFVTYGFERGAGQAFAFPAARAKRELVFDTFQRAVVPMILQVEGREVLHASAVHCADGVAAFCAVSGTGKSTVAYGLGRRGFPVWADDAVVLDAQAGRVIAIPVPFAVRLRPESAALFGLDETTLKPVAEPGEPAPLAALFVLQRDSAGTATSATVERLTPTEAFQAVLPHAYCFGLWDPARTRLMLESYLQLAQAVPVFRATLRSGIDQIEPALALIDRELERSAAA